MCGLVSFFPHLKRLHVLRSPKRKWFADKGASLLWFMSTAETRSGHLPLSLFFCTVPYFVVLRLGGYKSLGQSASRVVDNLGRHTLFTSRLVRPSRSRAGTFEVEPMWRFRERSAWRNIKSHLRRDRHATAEKNRCTRRDDTKFTTEKPSSSEVFCARVVHPACDPRRSCTCLGSCSQRSPVQRWIRSPQPNKPCYRNLPGEGSTPCIHTCLGI